MNRRRYQKKDPISHILDRNDMYVGSTRLRAVNEYIATLTGEGYKIEEKKIFDLHKKLGNKWADIAKELPGRSDNCIKNYFYSTHRKH